MLSFDEYTAMKASPHQRAFSLMAVPSELNQFHKQNPNQQSRRRVAWHQDIYKRFGYESSKPPLFFGPYLLLQTLGEGEFGKVKAAFNVETNRDVAIKLIRKDQIKDGIDRLNREIAVLKSLHHPNIVQLIEVITFKGFTGIVLQRAAGGELFDYILKHTCLQEKEAKKMFAQLISGVYYMHQKNIVHRDLKLENLLLSKERDIIISDFGFANRFEFEERDMMKTSCGSPCYAAPELVTSENAYVGTAADIWSCGVILYAILCGYLPFDDDPMNPDGQNINLLYRHILTATLEIPDTISLEAASLLRIMLVPDPEKRCTIDDIRHHPWLKEHQDLLSLDHMDSDSRMESPVPQVLQASTQIPESREQQQDNVTASDEEMEDIPCASSSSSTSSGAEPFQSKFITQLENKLPDTPRRNRTTSEYCYTSRKHTTLYPQLQQLLEAPSPAPVEQTRSTSQKFIDWIRRIPTPTQSTLSKSPKPTAHVNPIRAMPIGRPFGSYAADFNDSKIRLHRGAVDQDALTSKSPAEVLQALKDALALMGLERKRAHDFKLKCLRPSKNNKRSLTSKLAFFSTHHHPSLAQEPIYGDSSVDKGDEVQFTVEITKIENLPGLFVVDIRRLKGNIWAYKFLYRTLLELLDLTGKDQLGYLAHRQQQGTVKSRT